MITIDRFMVLRNLYQYVPNDTTSNYGRSVSGSIDIDVRLSSYGDLVTRARLTDVTCNITGVD